MKIQTTYRAILRKTLPVGVTAFCLGAGAASCDAQELFRKRLFSEPPASSLSTRPELAPKRRSGAGVDVSNWLESMDSFQTYPVGPALEGYDDEEKELLAKRAAVRMVGAQLEKVVKTTSLADSYKTAAKAVERSKNLVTFSDTNDSPSDSSDELPSAPAIGKTKKKIAFGFDAIRGFSPTLSLGENARLTSDLRRGDVMLEWRYGF